MSYLPLVVAEIGCNHKGDISLARQMIYAAKECGCSVAKFQKRHVKSLLTQEEYEKPHPNPENSYGKTYGEHREALEFPIEQHLELAKLCDEIGIIYAVSVWDEISAREIVEIINPQYIKIGSPSNLNYPIYEYLKENYKRAIHVSFGMTYQNERNSLINYLFSNFDIRSLFLYSCTSEYPVSYSNIRLDELTELKKFTKNIGFSGHHLGYAVDIAAYMLGARFIERHFTLNKAWKGTDHKASLDYLEMKEFTKELRNVYCSRGYKIENNGLLDCEFEQRKKLKKIKLLA